MANNAQATLNLRDIHLPDPVSWWPLAPGWWLLLALLVLAIAAFYLFRFYQKKQAIKKQVLIEFERLCQRHDKDKNSIALIQSLSTLLRRACISFYPRSEVASLTGSAWLDFLESTGSKETFNTEQGKLIASAPYLAENTLLNFDIKNLITICHDWLKIQPSKNHQKEVSKS